MWKVCAFAALIALLSILIIGCSKQPVAVVNGEKITEQEFTKRLKKAHGEQVLGDMIFRAMINDAAQKQGVTISEEELEKAIQQDKSQAPSEQVWQNMLASRGMTPQEYREEKKFSMKLQKLAQKDVDVSEEALKKFFEENKEGFRQPETVEISEIVVSSKEEAQKLYSQLQQNPDLFGDLARQHSLSPQTREQGGKRGEIPLQRLTPVALRKAVEDMQVGDVSRPIDASGNWYVVRLDNHTAASQPSFEDVRDRVKQVYEYQHMKGQQELLDELRKQSQVTIIDPEYQKLNELFRPQGADKMPSFGEGEKAPARGQDQGQQTDKEAEKAYNETAPDADAQPADDTGDQ